MKTTSPDQAYLPAGRQVHHDTSLSAFATGLLIGTLATLVLATEEGRAAGKKLLTALKETSKDLAPELEKLPGRLSQVAENIRTDVNTFDPLNNLHRTPPTSTGSTFHRDGEPLR